MRVLILSANTGGGHNSTANALGEQLQKMQVEYKIADSLAYISEKYSEIIRRNCLMKLAKELTTFKF